MTVDKVYNILLVAIQKILQCHQATIKSISSICIKSLVDVRKIVVPADTYIWHRKASRYVISQNVKRYFLQLAHVKRIFNSLPESYMFPAGSIYSLRQSQRWAVAG
jgi:hypothetical protein